MKTKTILGTLSVLGLLTLRLGAQITVDNVITNGLHEPYDVAASADNLFYLTDSANHRVVRYDPNSGLTTTVAGINGVPGSNDGPPYLAHFFSPQGIALATNNGVYGLVVADTGNHTIRFVNLTNGSVSTLAGRVGVAGGPADGQGTNVTFSSPVGLSVNGQGVLFIADSGNDAIRVIDLKDATVGVTNLVVNNTTFYAPNAVAAYSTTTGSGTNAVTNLFLWVADTRDHAVKLLSLTGPASGTMTSVLGSDDLTDSGSQDNDFGPAARFNNPRGLLFLGAGGLVVADTGNQTIRLATNNPVFGPGNYAVTTIAGIAGQSGFVNGAALSAKFAGPHGMARDVLGAGFLVCDTGNNAVRRIQTGPTQPPVQTPVIGWVDFEQNGFGTFVTKLRTDQPFVFNNDRYIAFLTEAGTETFFTYGDTPPSPFEDTIPNPTRLNGTSAPFYRDGIPYYSDFLLTPLQYAVSLQQPDFTVKVIGTQDGRQSSQVASARFQFKTANPIVSGDNAANFKVWDITDGASMWYTTDGVTDPSPNGTNSVAIPTATASSPFTLTLNASESNLVFKVRAFRNNYKDSDVVTRVFSPSNFIPNRISFGFESGEASSVFVASPGQTFYAPVTLTTLPGTTIYSLQFNVLVKELTGPPLPTSPAPVEFSSMLQEAVVPFLGTKLPPQQQQWYRRIPTAMTIGFTTNCVGTNCIVTPVLGGTTFTNSTSFPNGILLGTGWFERWGFANLYNTLIQDLISFSIARDTLFQKINGRVVCGAYGFQVPLAADLGDTYRIQIGRPSATSDGVGAPGSDVFIDTPQDGSLTNGTINATKIVTVGQPVYIAGDVAPFHWLNAGDFGNTNLLNDDVEQVFETAIYFGPLEPNEPPHGSDFYDALDSCCSSGVTNGATVYRNGGATNASPVAVFGGNDASINSYAFGDGKLDITDVYVTFRRSLDCSLTWWQRFHTTAGQAAVTVPNQFRGDTNCPPPAPAPSAPAPAVTPAVKFSAGDGIAAAGQTVLVPITARILGDYPLRVLGLNLTVEPLDGSPALTAPVQFTPVSALGSPAKSAMRGNGSIAGAWLNSTIAGLTGDAQLGTLQVTLPANATASSAYAIRFAHASGSPNGLASFARRTGIGLITTSDRSGSTFNDGISDSWRLRYFGSANNLLSQANADADGDGATNMQEYNAGTNPNDATSALVLSSTKGQDFVVRWPSVLNKQYVIERAASIYSPVWSAISTNAGTGWDMEFHDTSASTAMRFYRVRLLQ